jgi:adenylate cyclase
MGFLWSVQVSEDRRALWEDEVEGPLEVGRQDRGEPVPFTVIVRDGRQRLIIARTEETDIGRRHALLSALPDGRLHLENKSGVQPIRLLEGRDLAPTAALDLALPAVFALGRKTVRVQQATPAELMSLPAAWPPQHNAQTIRFPSLGATGAAPVDSAALLQWLASAMDVLQAAAGATDFFERAASAAFEMADLDSAQVLLLEEGVWRPRAARHGPGPGVGAAGTAEVGRPSQHVLSRLLAEKRTCWEALRGRDRPPSLANVEAVVAAPILHRDGSVRGALYGDRRRGGDSSAAPLTEVDAMLVELVARSVAAGLARLEQERAALAARVQFEQFFTPQLADQLARHPDWLQGRRAEVTILFCDIWGFSRISERIGPEATVGWIHDALSVLSDCILAQGGVLVDYVGDALMAMWGAPEAQPDHAARACRAALDMLSAVPDLNRRWQGVLGEPFELSIGVNTGPAQVGNVGSKQKFKYGGLGNTINLASRVQGVTKQLRCRLLITHETRAQLDDTFSLRRLGRFQVVNISTPIDLYELALPGRAGWDVVRPEYGRALDLFEAGEFAQAARALGNLLAQHADDAAVVLLYRAVRCMVEGPPASHPVWVLKEK